MGAPGFRQCEQQGTENCTQLRGKNVMVAATKTIMAAEECLDFRCPVCLDVINDMARLDCCKHKFCFCCIREWSKNKTRCPLCKQSYRFILHSFIGENDFEKFVVKPADEFDSSESLWSWEPDIVWSLWELYEEAEYNLRIENILNHTLWDDDTPELPQSFGFPSSALQELHNEGATSAEGYSFSYSKGSVFKGVAPAECSNPVLIPNLKDPDWNMRRNERQSPTPSESHSHSSQSLCPQSHHRMRLLSSSPSSISSISTHLRSQQHHHPGRKRKYTVQQLEPSVTEASSTSQSSAGVEMEATRRDPPLNKKRRLQDRRCRKCEQIPKSCCS
ncbi:E3 ubiquitin-protein ligase Topors [Arapaima gigas]